jgi:hypothetical protein
MFQIIMFLSSFFVELWPSWGLLSLAEAASQRTQVLEEF